MTKPKLLTSEAKSVSTLAKKINRLNHVLALERTKKNKFKRQITLDYNFKKTLRTKYPEIYDEIVEALE